MNVPNRFVNERARISESDVDAADEAGDVATLGRGAASAAVSVVMSGES